MYYSHLIVLHLNISGFYYHYKTLTGQNHDESILRKDRLTMWQTTQVLLSFKKTLLYCKTEAYLWQRAQIKRKKNLEHFSLIVSSFLDIQLQFPETLYIRFLDIYETYNAGGIKRILAKDTAGFGNQYGVRHKLGGLQNQGFSHPHCRLMLY